MDTMLNWLAENGLTFWSYVLTFIMGAIFSAAPLIFRNFHLKMVNIAQITLVIEELKRMENYVNMLGKNYSLLYGNYEARYGKITKPEDK